MLNVQKGSNHVAELAENSVSAIHAQAMRKVEKSKGYVLKQQPELAQNDKDDNM